MLHLGVEICHVQYINLITLNLSFTLTLGTFLCIEKIILRHGIFTEMLLGSLYVYIYFLCNSESHISQELVLLFCN